MLFVPGDLEFMLLLTLVHRLSRPAPLQVLIRCNAKGACPSLIGSSLLAYHRELFAFDVLTDMERFCENNERRCSVFDI